MANKYLDLNGLLYFWKQVKARLDQKANSADFANKTELDQIQPGDVQKWNLDSEKGAADIFPNAETLNALSVDAKGKLLINGAPVDTDTIVKATDLFMNTATLNKLGTDAQGNLTLNGVKVDTDTIVKATDLFMNAATLNKLGIDAQGDLTLDGVKVDTDTVIQAVDLFTNAETLKRIGATPEGHLTLDGKKITYDEASGTQSGLMSSADKAKLDGIQAGAETNPDMTKYVSKTELPELAPKPDLTPYAKSAQVYSREQIDSKLSSAMTYKGEVQSYVKLPTGAALGDVYNIRTGSEENRPGDNAAWNGTSWDILSGVIDLSGYLQTTEVITNSDIDGVVASV